MDAPKSSTRLTQITELLYVFASVCDMTVRYVEPEKQNKTGALGSMISAEAHVHNIHLFSFFRILHRCRL